jgi:ribosomal protein S6 kinase alpha-5
VSGGELFTHLYQREKFKENEVRIYIAEIVVALQHLHKVTKTTFEIPNHCVIIV